MMERYLDLKGPSLWERGLEGHEAELFGEIAEFLELSKRIIVMLKEDI
jgi:hypothetical protein